MMHGRCSPVDRAVCPYFSNWGRRKWACPPQRRRGTCAPQVRPLQRFLERDGDKILGQTPSSVLSQKSLDCFMPCVVLSHDVCHPERGEGSAFRVLAARARKTDSSLRSE